MKTTKALVVIAVASLALTGCGVSTDGVLAGTVLDQEQLQAEKAERESEKAEREAARKAERRAEGKAAKKARIAEAKRKRENCIPQPAASGETHFESWVRENCLDSPGANGEADSSVPDEAEVVPAFPAEVWRCHYSPTYNYDWHDDVVCSNGVEQHRPYLREWDDFVTEDEIMQSAYEYEQELNSW